MRDSYQHAIRVFEAHNGFLRSSQAHMEGVNPKTLVDMVAAGILIREARGLYRLASIAPMGNPDLALVARRVPDAVICLVSALALYELTTLIPHKVYIALPYAKRRKPTLDYPPLEIVWLSGAAYAHGVERVSMDSIDVPVYGPEKTIADCFKFRGKIGRDIAGEALKAYIKRGARNIPRLLEHARVDRVEKVLLPYLEALL